MSPRLNRSCSSRKALVNVGSVLGQKGELIAFEQPLGSSARREIGRFSAGEVPYVHSFGLTPESVILVGHPWLVRPSSLLWSNRGFRAHVR